MVGAVERERWQVGAYPLQVVVEAVLVGKRLFHLGRFSVVEGVKYESDEMITRRFAHKLIGRCRVGWG